MSDHNIIGITQKLNFVKSSLREKSKYNAETFKNELRRRRIPWENCLAETNFDDSWNLFKLYLTDSINKYCPFTERKIRGKERFVVKKDSW